MKRAISSVHRSQDPVASKAKRSSTTMSSREKENTVNDFERIPISSKNTASTVNSSKSMAGLNRTTQSQRFSENPIASKTSLSAKRSRDSGSSRVQLTVPKPTDQLLRTTVPANSQVRSLAALSIDRSHATSTQSSIRSTPSTATASNFTPRRSPLRDRSSNTTTDALPVHSLVEGSMEYRELKRLYVREQQQVEEWRKDYQVLKRQIADLKATTIPRPTAEVFEWLKELLDLLKYNGTFSGDGRTLDEIGKDLGIDSTNLATVAARTPQKSALKLFRLLYLTVAQRAECRSVKNIPQELLQNIYAYVRTLHPNLTFRQRDMHNAIGTSIRSAKSDLRKLQRYRQQQTSTPQFDRSQDGEVEDEIDENATGNVDTALHTSETSEEEDDDDEDEDNESEEDEETNGIMIDEEVEEDDLDE